MPLEFLQSLSEMELFGGLAVLSLLIGAIIMAVGIIVAKIAKLIFSNSYPIFSSCNIEEKRKIIIKNLIKFFKKRIS